MTENKNGKLKFQSVNMLHVPSVMADALSWPKGKGEYKQGLT